MVRFMTQQHVSRAAVAVAAAAVLAMATASFAPAERPTPQDATTFLARTITRIAANRYASVWPSLNPAQKRAIPEARYVTCELRSPVRGTLTALTALSVRSERVRIAGGLRHDVPSVAVGFRIELSDLTTGATSVVFHTAHAIWVGDRWSWILPPARFAADRRPDCGDPAYDV